MAQLKWNEISAPVSAAPLQGLNLANSMIGSGLGNFATGLGDYADQRVLAELAKYTDPTALNTAVQSGALDTSNASKAALGVLMQRPGQLITNQQQQLALDTNRVMDPLRIEQQIESNRHNAVINPQREAAGALSNTKAQTEWDRAEATRANQIIADQIYTQAIQGGALTPARMQEVVSGYQANPELYKMLVGKMQQHNPEFGKGIFIPNLPDVGGVSGVAGSSTGAAVSPEGAAGTFNGSPYDIVYGGGKFGTPPKPLTESTIKEVVDFGNNVLIPNTRGTLKNQPATVGTSASGRYQFTQETLKDLAPKVLGKDWENMTFDAATQDKLGEALFNQRKSGNLKATWEGLPDSRPGAYADKTWEEMKGIIESVESRTALSDPAAQARAIALQNQQNTQTVTQAQEVVNMFGSTETADRMLAAQRSIDPTKPSTAQAEMKKLVGANGALAGVDENDVLEAIKQVQTELGVAAPVAAALVEETVERGYNLFGSNLGFFDKQKIDNDALEAKLDLIAGPKGKNGKRSNLQGFKTVFEALSKNTAYTDTQASMKQRDEAVQNLSTQLQAAIASNGGTPAEQQRIAALQAQLAVAQTRSGAANQSAINWNNSILDTPQNAAQTNTPAAPTPVAKEQVSSLVPATPTAPFTVKSPNSFYSTDAVAERAKKAAEREKQQIEIDLAKAAEQAERDLEKKKQMQKFANFQSQAASTLMPR